jgi:hypothetical protein
MVSPRMKMGEVASITVDKHYNIRKISSTVYALKHDASNDKNSRQRSKTRTGVASSSVGSSHASRGVGRAVSLTTKKLLAYVRHKVRSLHIKDA